MLLLFIRSMIILFSISLKPTKLPLLLKPSLACLSFHFTIKCLVSALVLPSLNHKLWNLVCRPLLFSECKIKLPWCSFTWMIEFLGGISSVTRGRVNQRKSWSRITGLRSSLSIVTEHLTDSRDFRLQSSKSFHARFYGCLSLAILLH